MEQIRARSFARAGLLGNPSDGYYGKTMSFAFANYCVDLRLAESARMRFVPGEVDDAMFDSPEQLVHDLRLFGYYGGIRMLKAVAKLFFEYCFDHGITLPKRNFTAEYRTNIPRLVGLSGSSAICSAMLKALCRFYEVPIVQPNFSALHSQPSTLNSPFGIPLEETPTICLEAERDELGINCGFQDRVIQMYGGLVFMDFNRDYVMAHNRGIYEPLDPTLIDGAQHCGGLIEAALPASRHSDAANSNIPNSDIQTFSISPLNLYIAYDPNRAEESSKAHKKVKSLFEAKKPDILAAMGEFADIAQQGRDLLVSMGGTRSVASAAVHAKFAELVNANFDLRDRIFNVSEQNRNMVMVARSAGCSAKFAGSGGAIVGTYENDEQYALLVKRLATIGCTTLKPIIGTRDLESRAISEESTSWRNS